jgi:membrane fusion protein, copper/silver efflux system
MKKTVLIVGVVGLIALAYFVGSWSSPRAASPSPAVPAKTGAEASGVDASSGNSSENPPGTVAIGPEKQQLIGIRVGIAEKGPVRHTFRVLGRVAVDETRQYIINASTNGWVMDISSATPGSFVRRDEVLASFYAPELLGAQQSFLYGLGGLDRAKERAETNPGQVDTADVSVTQYRDALRNLGMGPTQIEEIAKTRERVNKVDMVSPTTGIVIYRNIFPGLKFIQGQEFFRIADLSRVWILLDVFENEGEFLKPGAKAMVSAPHQGKVFEASVSNVLPLFDPTTRTLKVRLEAANPDYALRPDMFVDVEIPVALAEATTVPADAVLDSGLKKTVFVALEGGYFEPREVETGRRLGDRVEVTRGLEAGERIVTAGTFLVDSESRMDLALSGMAGTLARDPVCGMSVSMAKAKREGRKSIVAGKTYYFCSEKCKALFDANPGAYQ